MLPALAAQSLRSGSHAATPYTGAGGPCAATGKKTNSDYVYMMQFTDGKISHMTKIWNSGVAFEELGWA